jgi:hypothetical protein
VLDIAHRDRLLLALRGVESNLGSMVKHWMDNGLHTQLMEVELRSNRPIDALEYRELLWD